MQTYIHCRGFWKVPSNLLFSVNLKCVLMKFMGSNIMLWLTHDSFARLAPLLFWSLPLLGEGYFHCTPGDAAGHWTLLRSPVRASANHMQFAAPCSFLPIYCQRLKSMFSLGVFVFLFCVRLYVCNHRHAMVHVWSSEGSLLEFFSPSSMWVPETQFSVSLGSKHLTHWAIFTGSRFESPTSYSCWGH